MISRQQGVVIGVGAVLGLACAGISVVLVLALSKSNASKANLDNAYQELQKIDKAKILPSTNNITQIQEDRQKLETWLAATTNDLAKSAVPVKSLSRSQFKSRLEDAIVEMRKQSAVGGKTARVSADFRFGFDKYKGGELPPDDEMVIIRLAQQLDIIQQIVGELYEANVAKLEVVGREVFEDGEAAAAAAQPQASGRRARGGAAQAGGEASSALNPALAALFDRQRFTVQFHAYPEAFADVLNRLSSMDLFIVVADMDVRKTSDSVQQAERKSSSAAGGKQGDDADETAVRIVTDPKREPPVNVRLSLDVYSFKGV